MPIATSENILKLLYSYNPWWRDGILPKNLLKPTRRLAYYEAINLLTHPDLRRHVIISGARRVGKTTLLYQMIETLLGRGIEAKKILYVSFDHPLLKFCGMDELVNIYETNVALAGEAYLFFDEVQYASDWDRWLKVFYDTKPDWRIAATGSASPILAQGASESGVGRWTVIPVPTLSFYEYCEITGVEERPTLDSDIKPTSLTKLKQRDLLDLMNCLAPLQKHFFRYLTVGGFPELALSGDSYYAQRMMREDVVDKVLKRDIPALFNIRNAAVLEKVFLYLCFNSSNIINITTISKELDNTPTVTISNYIQFLEQANLIYVSYPINLDGKKVLKARPKIYIADAAIRNAVLMLEDVLADPEQMGVMVETAVYKHLASFYFRSNARVGYYRRSGGSEKEIDVVVELPQGRVFVEVKYRENAVIKEKEAIVEVSKEEKKAEAAVVVTKRAEDFGIMPYDTRVPIMRIPAHVFLYLLGHAEKALIDSFLRQC
ncbi:MAG: ATP-binding protein [Syntrophothermus sp.]|uniref:ATP-binding protein n=1 Tax=Syntrophothermus sp. TaxID=2736299 RepID=UPI00257F6597|nr:ATP-binding protein [Syntrophothermus sp.]NSW83922.1 ATP-binding protein [Syntrophothermus sp.]